MTFNTHDTAVFLLGIGLLLGCSRLLGEIARRFRQPMVVGELLAGILLGPTVLGRLSPGGESSAFPLTGTAATALQGLAVVAIVLLLFVAGMEINLSSIWKQGKSAILISLTGIVFPLALGFAAAWCLPGLFGWKEGVNLSVFALFFGVALSISALPIIAKTLMDMNLLKSDYGVLILSAGALNDLVGWLVFSVIVGIMSGGSTAGAKVRATVVATLLLAAVTLTLVRRGFDRALPWLERHTTWPGGILAAVLAVALLWAAGAEHLGVHAVFGAFLIGIAVGDSHHLSARTKDVISQFTVNIFAPLFFGFIGLRIDFAGHFSPLMVGTVFVLACIGKIVGCSIGARLGGMDARDAVAVGFGMNSRGTMEIILGLVALEHGVIGENLFVALVFMAVGTTMISGFALERLLRETPPPGLSRLISPSGYNPFSSAANAREAIRDLSALAARETGLEPDHIFREVWKREEAVGTAIGQGIAVPHARMPELAAPFVAVGRFPDGVSFDSPDGAPVHMVFLILTKENDGGAQLRILSDIARAFSQPEVRAAAFRAEDLAAFSAALEKGVKKKAEG